MHKQCRPARLKNNSKQCMHKSTANNACTTANNACTIYYFYVHIYFIFVPFIERSTIYMIWISGLTNSHLNTPLYSDCHIERPAYPPGKSGLSIGDMGYMWPLKREGDQSVRKSRGVCVSSGKWKDDDNILNNMWLALLHALSWIKNVNYKDKLWQNNVIHIIVTIV